MWTPSTTQQREILLAFVKDLISYREYPVSTENKGMLYINSNGNLDKALE